MAAFAQSSMRAALFRPAQRIARPWRARRSHSRRGHSASRIAGGPDVSIRAKPLLGCESTGFATKQSQAALRQPQRRGFPTWRYRKVKAFSARGSKQPYQHQRYGESAQQPASPQH